MKPRNRSQRRLEPRALVAAVSFVLLPSGCSEPERTEKTTGGETHFLKCATDSDCTPLSSPHRCVEGLCRPVTNPLQSQRNSGGASGTVDGGSPQCAHGAVAGPQVLVLGDTFMALTHQITADLENLARARGALSQNQEYRDESTVTGNSLAYGGSGILDQYARAIAAAPVEVVVMNGGGSDVLQGFCAAPLESCPVIVNAADAAGRLFARMAADRVAHVVYAYYPDPAIPSVRDKIDAMRPLMQAACETSAVPCHWVDLRVAFAGHYADYLASDGLDPTAAGSQASAIAIGEVMQRYCVAQ